MTTMEKTYRYGDGTQKTMIRIYADKNKAVTNDGNVLWKSVDVESIDGWYDVADPEPVEDEPTDEDYAEVGKILMGKEE